MKISWTFQSSSFMTCCKFQCCSTLVKRQKDYALQYWMWPAQVHGLYQDVCSPASMLTGLHTWAIRFSNSVLAWVPKLIYVLSSSTESLVKYLSEFTTSYWGFHVSHQYSQPLSLPVDKFYLHFWSCIFDSSLAIISTFVFMFVQISSGKQGFHLVSFFCDTFSAFCILIQT